MNQAIAMLAWFPGVMSTSGGKAPGRFWKATRGLFRRTGKYPIKPRSCPNKAEKNCIYFPNYLPQGLALADIKGKMIADKENKDTQTKGPEMKSITNTIMESQKKEMKTYNEGDGVTMTGFSDRHAGTVSRVSESGKTIWVSQDIATRIDDNGMADTQTYSYKPGDNSFQIRFSWSKKGYFKNNSMGYGLFAGRDEYYDFSF